MKNKKLFFAALFFAALAFGFVGCENPDDESGISIEKPGDDSTSDKPTTPEEPMLVATGGATDVEYSSVTLWGRLNTDTLVFFPKVKWGVEYSTSKENISSHSGKEALCTTKLVGENADEFSVELTGVGYGKMLYYNAYLLINDIKYVYGEVDSVHMDVYLTLKANNSDYGTVTGSGTYDYGAEATITATPKENYYFTGWSDSDSKELSRTITIISDTTITAIFSEEPYLTAKPNDSYYGTVTGSGHYAVGSEATITATPKENYYFTGWSDSDSKELTRTVQVNSDTTITANFAKNPYLTAKPNNSNYGTVTGSGHYAVGSEATITATPKENYYFTGWSDCDSKELTRTVQVNSDTTITANFVKNPYLTAKPNNSDYGTVTGSGLYEVGTKVTITATPKENYYFTGWSDCDSKELTRIVQVNSDTTIIANFAKNPYLTAKPNNSNYGTVTGSGYYDVGAEATITATPKENCYFTGWSDSDSKELTRTVQVNSNKTITANFAKKPYLTVKTNKKYGTVTGSGYYDVGSEATITATPKNDYIEFVQWSDGNTENPRTITVTSDVTYTATFKVNLPGSFSVSNTTQVYFSSGNLQYHPANDEWRFAESQLDYIGASNSNCSSTYNGWLDLFGWSTSATHFGVSTSTDYENDYLGSFVDWGTNQIGSDSPNTWRTLTYDEWRYLLNTRPNASSLKGVAQVNGVNGLILLPDGWSCPDGVTFRSGFHDSWCVECYAAYQTFTAAEWSRMEAAGAVFLPAAGWRNGSDVSRVQYYGHYWSATEYTYDFAYYLYFISNGAYMYTDSRYLGLSVRLVKDL